MNELLLLFVCGETEVDTWFRLIILFASMTDCCNLNFSSCTVDFGEELETSEQEDDTQDMGEGKDGIDCNDIWSDPRQFTRVLWSSSDSCCTCCDRVVSSLDCFPLTSSLDRLWCPDSCKDWKFNWREPLLPERFDSFAAIDLDTTEGIPELNEGIFDFDDVFGVSLTWSTVLTDCLDGGVLWGSREAEDDLLDSFERLVMDEEDRLEGVLLNNGTGRMFPLLLLLLLWLCCLDDGGEEVTNDFDEGVVLKLLLLFKGREVLATEVPVIVVLFLTFVAEVVWAEVAGLFCCCPVSTAAVPLLITLLPDPANEVDLGVDEEGEEVGGNNGVDFEFGREGRGVELKAVKKQSWTSTPASLNSLALMITLLACLLFYIVINRSIINIDKEKICVWVQVVHFVWRSKEGKHPNMFPSWDDE